MIGQQLRRERELPLEGPRQFVAEQRGEFLLRVNPEHVAEARAAIHRRNVLTDIANFRALTNRENNARLLRDLG